MMDSLAKQLTSIVKIEQLEKIEQHYRAFPQPQVHNSIIRQNHKSAMYQAIMTRKAHDYWISKDRYKEEDIQCLDWENVGKAFTSERRTRQRNLTKWFSGWLGTGKNMKRWKLRYSGKCPFCGEEDEYTKHILQCTHELPCKARQQALLTFDGSLIKLNSNFNLRKAVIKELRAWFNSSVPPSLEYVDADLKNAILEQRGIGWRSFMEGLISKKANSLSI